MYPQRWLIALMVAALLLEAGLARAAVISEVESNNSYSQAQNLDSHFTLDYRSDIDTLWVQNPGGTWTATNTNTSQTIPHVTVEATGDGTVDFYSFEGTAGSTAILDLDHSSWYPPYDLNPQVHVWFSGSSPHGGDFVAGNNDMGSSMLSLDTGSNMGTDPLVQFELPGTGTYYIGVADVTAVAYGWIPAYYQPAGVKDGGTYTLHVSVGGDSVIPEPSTLVLLSMGALALTVGWWRRRQSGRKR